jgi:transcriptional regulator with XRE-family HTH domain
MKRIGDRIKKQREKQNLPLGELARKVGITSSALSQIENAKSFPSIITLKSIAENLHTSVSDLIGENEPYSASPVTQKNEIKLIETNSTGVEVYLLSEHDLNKHMDAFLIKMQPGANISELFSNHANQRFCYVLKGEVVLQLNNTEYRIGDGDNAYFHSKAEHYFTNTTNEVAEFIMVISPPND